MHHSRDKQLPRPPFKAFTRSVCSSFLQTLLLRLLLLPLAFHLRHFVCASVWFHVPEERELGTLVGLLGKHYPPPYKLLTRDYFWMDKITGNFYTTENKMDRETLCPKERLAEECITLHNALVGPSGDLIQFSVIIEDVNDNPPRFPNSEICLRVSEDVMAGTGLLLDEQAVDEDVGENGQVRYHLEDSDGAFSLRAADSGITLLVEAGLDRESRDEYQMLLVATDCGQDPLSATATLLVQVTDVDDNCPSFEAGSSLRVEVPSDSKKNTLVAQVRATDPDTRPNAAITYSLSPRVSERAKKLFSLDSLTGHIRLAKDLRSDTSEKLLLKVLASGRGCPPADTLVTISVLPRARQELTVRIRFLAEHQDQTVVVAENQPPTTLAVLELEGGGSDGFESSSLSIENKVPFALSLQKSRYLLSTSKALDRETKSEHNISLLAQGTAADGTAFAPFRHMIRVMVEDVNDNTPHFLQSPFQLEVEENNQPGRSLLQILARDADAGSNGMVTYRLCDCEPPIFKIDPETGQLTASAPLDREQQAFYQLSVFARDSGSPPMESMMSVCIRVLDQNDNAPVFQTPLFVFFIPEDAAPSTLVGQVEVTDADENENGYTKLQLVDNSETFSLNGPLGTLHIVEPLDRETQECYELFLLASDHGHPLTLTTTARVTVLIQDVNDNPPKVILPGGNSSCTPVSVQTAASTTVTKVLAIDQDLGLNSQITYTVVAPAAATSPFRLDSRSGNITTAEPLLPKHRGMHHLFIVVRDGGEPAPLYTTVWVNLLVNDSVEPCHLDRAPTWTGIPNLVPFPSKAPICKAGGSRYAQLTLLVGSGMMLASMCLLAAIAVLCRRSRRRSGMQKQGHCADKENEIPVRHKDKYYSED